MKLQEQGINGPPENQIRAADASPVFACQCQLGISLGPGRGKPGGGGGGAGSSIPFGLGTNGRKGCGGGKSRRIQPPPGAGPTTSTIPFLTWQSFHPPCLLCLSYLPGCISLSPRSWRVPLQRSRMGFRPQSPAPIHPTVGFAIRSGLPRDE
jgi:hypothetical protein